jgi:4-hydroxy-tetrahydrodipicolinate reductase
MKIALLGFGNMGKEVARMVEQEENVHIVAICLKNKAETIDTKTLKHADVVIDFTGPDAVLHNIQTIAPLGIAMVIGTTGWYDKLDKVKALVKKYRIGLIYGQNFSIGANIFFQIISFASKKISAFDYDVYGYEIHHIGKKDSPSGTAKKLAEIILKNFPKKKELKTEKITGQHVKEVLHFASLRGGRNPGLHEIIFDSVYDEITISHQVHSRSGFAKGALLAAEFIKDKKGFHSFDDFFTKEVKFDV